MKVLVTGATGGLGTLIVNNLLSRGIEVVATSRDQAKAEKSDFFNKVIFKAYSIENNPREDLYAYFEKPDALIHCAWDKLGAAEYKNPMHTQVILGQHKDFLKNLLQNGLKDITVIGSVYEYGITEGELSEDMPSEPTVEYSIAKNLLREFLQEEQANFDFVLKWMRVFYVFGEVKGRKNLYTLLAEAVNREDKTFNMSGGQQTRDFLTSEEIADIIVRASIQKEVNGIINCCSGKPVVLIDIIQDYIKKHNSSIELNLGFYPYPDYEPMHTWGSVEKLNKIK
ncbi:epimerase [Sphingobacteriaceae bacterium]|nr:epimerase [Sphingobacteriaceae bacterium]